MTGNRFFHNGNRIKKKLFSKKFKLMTGDGQEHTIEMKGQFFDSLPKILVDGAEVSYVEKLATWQYAISGLALLEIFVSFLVVGGVLGAIPGFIAFYLSQNIMRSNENTGTGAILALVTVGAAWVIWGILAVLVFAVALNS